MLKKNHFLVLLLFPVLYTASLHAFTPKIFYVNLYNKAVDVRLGSESNYIFIMNGLGPKKATYMVNANPTGSYNLYFKVSTKNEWIQWADASDNAFSCDVVADKDYCIVTGTDGNAMFYTLEEPDETGAKVCFFNGTDANISRMEIGEYWGTPKAFIDDLSPNAVSSFVVINPGSYSLFWKYCEQKKKTVLADDGKSSEVYSFESGTYYLFLTYLENSVDYGILYIITPPGAPKDKTKKKSGSKLED